MLQCSMLRERKLRQGVWPQPKVIQDSNPDFKINLNSDPDVCRIDPKILWIHYLVSVSDFVGRKNHLVTVNLKSIVPQQWGKWKSYPESEVWRLSGGLRSLSTSSFYRATLMHSADYAVARCLSVCPSVHSSVCHTPVFCLNGYTCPESFFAIG